MAVGAEKARPLCNPGGMMPFAASCRHPDAARRSDAAGAADGRYRILLDEAAPGVARRWNARMGDAAATPFQTGRWIEAWYETLGRVVGDPLRLTVLDRRTGELAAMLPLVRRTEGRLRVITFADNGVSDNNAPVLGPASPADADQAQAFWDEIRKALPDADLVRFTKMPPEIEGRPNPLALLRSARRSVLSRNVVALGDGEEDQPLRLTSTHRKQLDRAWRRFTGYQNAEFRRITDPDEAGRVLATLEQQQQDRLQRGGASYLLDRPEFSAFYRQLTAEGVAEGRVIITALMRGDEVVAALLGVAYGTTYVTIRISSGSAPWIARCSPGRLIIVRTMQLLQREGYRTFDLSIGDYEYKRRLGASPQPLLDLTLALSPRGLPAVVVERAKYFVRRHPMLLAATRSIVKRAGSQGGDPDPD